MGRPSNAELAARNASNPGEQTNAEGAEPVLSPITGTELKDAVSPLPLPEPAVNQPQTTTIEQAKQMLIDAGYKVTEPGSEEPASLEAIYGPGYVTAYRESNGERETTYFTKQAWNNLDGNKAGWHRQIKTPIEVEELEKLKAQA